jgi:hypothetical protein
MTSRAATAPEPDGLSRRDRRQLADQTRTRRRVGPVLYSVMVPGERILAGTLGWTGRWRGLEFAASGAALVLYTALVYPFQLLGSVHRLAGTPARAVLFAAVYVFVALAFRHRWVLIALTDQQLICVRAPGSGRPSVWLRWPRQAIRMRGGPVTPLLRSKSVTLLAPGLRSGGIRINAPGVWRPDLDELVAELQAGGQRVGGYMPGGFRAAPPDRPDRR